MKWLGCVALLLSVNTAAYAYGDRVPIVVDSSYEFVTRSQNIVHQEEQLYIKKNSIKKAKKVIQSQWVILSKGAYGGRSDIMGIYGNEAIFTVNCKEGTYSEKILKDTDKGVWRKADVTSLFPEEEPVEGTTTGVIFEYLCGKKKAENR